MQECILVLTLSLWYQKISLKSIAKAMYVNQLIKTSWKDDITNGLDAMVEYYLIQKGRQVIDNKPL